MFAADRGAARESTHRAQANQGPLLIDRKI
jgi:hypothetical protein